jgi:hypothetical protein
MWDPGKVTEVTGFGNKLFGSIHSFYQAKWGTLHLYVPFYSSRITNVMTEKMGTREVRFKKKNSNFHDTVIYGF